MAQPPSLQRIDTELGPEWEICYGGRCRRHRQPWQAQVFWLQAQSAYALETLRYQPERLPSTSQRRSQLVRL